MKKEPTFFVVGTAKAGTTALFDYLDLHPQIFMSPIKEPHYFSTDIRVKNFGPSYRAQHKRFDIKEYLARPTFEKRHIEFIESWNDYVQLFRNMSDEKAGGEISTGYLYSETAAAEIAAKVPAAKIIMILRNPVGRAYSHYKMDRAGGAVLGTFIDELNKDRSAPKSGWGITHLYCELGLYHEQVARYLKHFAREQIYICLYDDWVTDNQRVLKDVAAFLDVDPFTVQERIVQNQANRVPVNAAIIRLLQSHSIKSAIKRCVPESIRRKMKGLVYRESHSTLSQEEKVYAYQFFQEDIDRLEQLIGKDLTHWKYTEKQTG